MINLTSHSVLIVHQYLVSRGAEDIRMNPDILDILERAMYEMTPREMGNWGRYSYCLMILLSNLDGILMVEVPHSLEEFLLLSVSRGLSCLWEDVPTKLSMQTPPISFPMFRYFNVIRNFFLTPLATTPLCQSLSSFGSSLLRRARSSIWLPSYWRNHGRWTPLWVL